MGRHPVVDPNDENFNRGVFMNTEDITLGELFLLNLSAHAFDLLLGRGGKTKERPAGIDIEAKTPFEIALSVIADWICIDKEIDFYELSAHR